MELQNEAMKLKTNPRVKMGSFFTGSLPLRYICVRLSDDYRPRTFGKMVGNTFEVQYDVRVI